MREQAANDYIAFNLPCLVRIFVVWLEKIVRMRLPAISFSSTHFASSHVLQIRAIPGTFSTSLICTNVC